MLILKKGGQRETPYINGEREKEERRARYGSGEILSIPRRKEEDGPWLLDGKGQIFRLYMVGPSGLKDYGSAMLRFKI